MQNPSNQQENNQQQKLLEFLTEILNNYFSGSINVIDDSHLHVGHNHNGGGHYTIHIVDEKFSDLSRLQRHRMIYDILEQHMHDSKGKIHALALKLYSPYEYFNELSK